MAHLKIWFFLYLGFCVASNNGERILGLFPHPAESHFQFFHPIMRGLADAGHNVTVISYFEDKNPLPNYKNLLLDGMTTLLNSIDLTSLSERRSFTLEFFLLFEWGKKVCESAFNSTVIKQLLKQKDQYDLIIMEQFTSDCMMGVAYQLNAPIIGASSCALMPWHYDRIGNPHIPSYIPALYVGYSDKMSLIERISNWIVIHGMQLIYRTFIDRFANNIIAENLGPGIPDVRELAKRTSLIFVNQHYSLSGSKPISPAVVDIGGIHIRDLKPLDPAIKEILDSADHGVIYISWGSMIRADTLPIKKRDSFLKALGMLPQKVLWKWENDTLPNQPPNVYIRKWMPQLEILCHPNVKVFMTHGGLLSSSEAAYCGVPVVSTPMYGDQFLNTAALINRGMGTLLSYEDISRESISAALKIALDPGYVLNAKRVSHSFKNRLQSAKKTAIWWAEHVIATRGAPLIKSNSIYMPWYSYYSLDVYAVLLVVLSICLGSSIWLLRRLFSKKSPTKLKTN